VEMSLPNGINGGVYGISGGCLQAFGFNGGCFRPDLTMQLGLKPNGFNEGCFLCTQVLQTICEEVESNPCMSTCPHCCTELRAPVD
jgi:hypothetical protein